MSDEPNEPTHIAIPIANFRLLMAHLAKTPGEWSYQALKQLEDHMGVTLSPKE